MKWINVKEQLPLLKTNENGERTLPSDIVMIYDRNNSEQIMGYFTVAGWKEFYGTSCGCCGIDDCIPSHWMPLPEPPDDTE